MNTMLLLTRKQQQILDFIRQQTRSGIVPTLREIQKRFKFASPSAVSGHLRLLEKKGALQRESGRSRNITLTGAKPVNFLEVPILGMIPAGLPADQEQISNRCISVDLDALSIPKNARMFALECRGDSMINAGILDKDVVVMEFKEARNKDIVAALIDGECTLKRYLVQRGKPFLRAENPKYPDLIPAQELVIQGVMRALIRTIK
ncbi:MAG: transcriptional repressor LexA [Chthoniobacterales bacterium]